MEDTFLTPKLRTGPTSRLLRRQPVVQRQEEERRTTITPANNRRISVLDDPRETTLKQRPYRILDRTYETSYLLDRSIMPADRSTLAETSVAVFDDRRGSVVYRARDDTTAVFDEENPGVAATENLFVDFLASCAGEEEKGGLEALDRVAEFEQLVGDHFEVLRDILAKYPGAANKFNKTLIVKENLKNERNTWRLLGKLYHDRLVTDVPMEDYESDDYYNVVKHSEKRIVERLFRRDRELREAQAIVDWLESNAVDDINRARLDRLFDASVGSENTLNLLAHCGDLRKVKSIVSELDPDAPRRQNKPLHDLDVQDQTSLQSAVFMCVRSGALESAQDLCVRVGQPWRAATFEGWKLFHDPNYEEGEEEGKKFPCEGNKTRDIWKRSAWIMTTDEKMPVFERASYSAYCGNAKQLLSVCKAWEDCLWALTRCFVDYKVESEIREKMTDKTFARLPQEYWDRNCQSVDQVLEAMEAIDNEDIRAEKDNPYRVIQCHLIVGDYSGLAPKMAAWAENRNADPHLLRLCAHLVIIFRRLGFGGAQVKDAEDSAIRSYVLYLMEADRVQQLAWYVSQLPVDAQIEMYSSYLEGVTAYGDRKLCLDLAVESGLPVEAIAVRTVVNVRTKEEAADEAVTFRPGTSEADLIKIDALSWLIFFESQRDEAVFQCNALMRALIAAGKIEAANLALAKIPPESISLINDHDEISPRVTNAVKEFLCLESYLRAQEAFSDWFDHYRKGQPVRPVLNDRATFVEKVAFEQKEEQYQIDLERWSGAQLVQSRAASERLLAVITFPQGWLQDGEEEEGDDQRLEEMEYLRRVCLPKLLILLHTVYHNTKQYGEAIKLADLVACERYAVFKVYEKDNLKEFLGKVRESSLAALETGNLDPCGFPKK